MVRLPSLLQLPSTSSFLDGGLELGLVGKLRAETLIRAGSECKDSLPMGVSAERPPTLPTAQRSRAEAQGGVSARSGCLRVSGSHSEGSPAEEGPGQELEGTRAWMSDACNASLVRLVLMLTYRARTLETSGVSGRFPHLSGPRTPRC